MRAGDRRRDGRSEEKAALAGVGGLVDWPAGAAHALKRAVCRLRDDLTRDRGRAVLARARLAPVLIYARTPSFAQGVGEARSHRST